MFDLNDAVELYASHHGMDGLDLFEEDDSFDQDFSFEEYELAN